MASIQLLAYLLVAKYADALPMALVVRLSVTEFTERPTSVFAAGNIWKVLVLA
jgi:hypothetical protein